MTTECFEQDKQDSEIAKQHSNQEAKDKAIIDEEELLSLLKIEKHIRTRSNIDIKKLKTRDHLSDKEKDSLKKLNNLLPSIAYKIFSQQMFSSHLNQREIAEILKASNKPSIQKLSADDIREYVPNNYKMVIAHHIIESCKGKVATTTVRVLLGLSRATFFRLRHNADNFDVTESFLNKYREVADAILEIRKQEGGKTYGYRRLQKKLDERGLHKSVRVILRLMQALGVQGEDK